VAIVAIGFASISDRAEHFKAHGEDFDATSAIEYEEMAVAFLSATSDAHIVEGIRRGNGDTVRFHRVTQAFAVMRSDGIIKTFYKPDPAWHGFSSNLAYFQNECAK
jgi:pyocin large subunit-like protein